MFGNKDLSKVLNKIKGDAGENLAFNYLKKKGYTILERNYKNRLGEIDIIAIKDEVIIFVEVKSRETCAYGRPIEAIDYHKVNKIKKVAEIYLMMKHKNYVDVRFDVIEVLGKKIEHIENAF